MEKLLDAYEMQFGECFPLMLCRSMSEDAICDIIQQCLDNDKPYEPDLDSSADY